MSRYQVNLSASELEKLITELKTNLKDLKDKNQEFVRKMTERGHQIVQEQIVEKGKINALSTGELFNSVVSVYDASANVGMVEVTAPHAAFVEFGTGVVGKGSPHPEAMQNGWNYDYNNRGSEGWLYFNPNDGKLHRTAGQPASPFFYDARKQLEDEKLSIAREVFKK